MRWIPSWPRAILAFRSGWRPRAARAPRGLAAAQAVGRRETLPRRSPAQHEAWRVLAGQNPRRPVSQLVYSPGVSDVPLPMRCRGHATPPLLQAPFSPHAFLHAMWCASEHFAGYEQQDAHEFLVAMLASIYSSMREPTAAAGPAPSQVEDSQLVRTPSLGGPSAGRSCQDLSSIFAGVLRSEVTCAKCRHRSVKREDFSDISLDLTRQYTAGRAGMEQVAGGDPAPAGLGKGGGLDGGGEASAVESLTACLRAFTGMEELSSDERCWCDKCGSLQNS